MNSVEEKPIIFVAEPLPGGGASTVSLTLEKLLNLEKISVGQFRRAIALYWANFQKIHPELTEPECWIEFESLFVGAMDSLDPAAAFLYLLGPYLDQFCDTPTLMQLTKIQTKYSLKQTVWDKIPDILAYTRLQNGTEKSGYIVDAKIGVRYEDILKEKFGKLREDKGLIVPIWLKVNIVNSAERVAKRDIENGKLQFSAVNQDILISWLNDRTVVTKEISDKIEAWYQDVVENLIEVNPARIAEDLQRYQTAYENDPPISIPYLLTTPELERIDANRPLDEVVFDALKVITDRVPSLATPLIQEILTETEHNILREEIDRITKRVRS